MDVLARLDAEQDWRDARRKLLYQKVICVFKVCSINLLAFEKIRSTLHLSQKHYLGLQEIPLEMIRGSVGRYDDFSSAFLPRKEHDEDRWRKVNEAMQAGKTPPIDVYQVGEVYFVADGNHRVSVARQRGLENIEAYVTEFPISFDLKPEDDLDDILLTAEQSNFLKLAGEENAELANSIQFTCIDCYQAITEHINIYSQQLYEANGRELSFSQVFPLWYEEVYMPVVRAIRKIGVMEQFPDRTEPDLYLWCWQNSQVIEEMESNPVRVDEKPG